MKPGLAFKKQRISCPLFAFKFHPLSLTRPMCEPQGEKDVPSVRFSRCWILLVHAWVSPCFPEPRTRKTHPALSSIANPSYIEKTRKLKIARNHCGRRLISSQLLNHRQCVFLKQTLNRTTCHLCFPVPTFHPERYRFQSQPSVIQTVEGPKERETFQASVVPTCCLYVANPRSEKVLQLFSSIQTRS